MSKLNFLEKYAVEDRHYDVEKEIDKALDSPNIFVRQEAIEHPKATEEHITKALNDKDIRQEARNHPNYRKFFPNGH